MSHDAREEDSPDTDRRGVSPDKPLADSKSVHELLAHLADGLIKVGSNIDALRLSQGLAFGESKLRDEALERRLDRALEHIEAIRKTLAERDNETGRNLAALAKIDARQSKTEEQIRAELSQRSAVVRAWRGMWLAVDASLKRNDRIARIVPHVVSWVVLAWVTAKPEIQWFAGLIRSLFSH